MLEARHITHAPGGKAVVLDDVSLTVEPGERVALVAPSGGGKTTLCRIVAGYEQPDAGEVLVDGAPLPRKGRCPVQLIGQHPEQALDPRMTIAASLAEALADVGSESEANDGEEVRTRSTARRGALRAHFDVAQHDLLERIGIRPEWLCRYPRELSGGELQRICIARALLARPRYLVADEITTSLDAVTQARIWHAVLEEAAARTMGLLLVTHSPALTHRLATRIVSLK